MDSRYNDASDVFERALLRATAGPHYVLQLFVAGTTARSLEAVERIKRLCERHLTGHYDLQVVDIYQHPEHAEGENILAAPTLVKRRPAPPRRVVGSMADERRVLGVIGVGGSA
jgi:circadian clock protein KaiB